MIHRTKSDYWDKNSIAAGLLQAALSYAVPLWIEKLKTQSMSVDNWEKYIYERRDRCLEIIAHHGDNILYRSKKPGGTAKAFNALVEAMAILSFSPGGVTAFDLHFGETK